MYNSAEAKTASEDNGKLKRIPNGREDIFSDRSIDVRAKRGLMKFLKFVVDYENQTEIWESYGELPLTDFLSSQFQLPISLQTVMLALTLTLDLPTRTYVRYSLPRIARHLTSIGVFGPGFGAVIPKWGGGSEIAQVSCRAGAVGGGVYILGTDVEDCPPPIPGPIIDLKLTNGEPIRSKAFVSTGDWRGGPPQSVGLAIAKTVAIVSSDLAPLFVSTVEGGPTAAVSVVVFPSNSLTANGSLQTYPVYIMVHSSDTGECPTGQCE
jgi:RAB protein geranylgeranyltransferase component A